MGGLGCDNMTVILICLLNGQTYEELCEKCSQPSEAHQRPVNGKGSGFY